MGFVTVGTNYSLEWIWNHFWTCLRGVIMIMLIEVVRPIH